MTKQKSIAALIDLRIREMLEEMADLPPGHRESMAGAIQKLLVAKPLASDDNMGLYDLLSKLDKGPKPVGEKENV